MAKPSKQLRILREELAYWQMQARMETRWLAASRAKCEAIETKIRELEPRRIERPQDWRPAKVDYREVKEIPLF